MKKKQITPVSPVLLKDVLAVPVWKIDKSGELWQLGPVDERLMCGVHARILFPGISHLKTEYMTLLLSRRPVNDTSRRVMVRTATYTENIVVKYVFEKSPTLVWAPPCIKKLLVRLLKWKPGTAHGWTTVYGTLVSAPV